MAIVSSWMHISCLVTPPLSCLRRTSESYFWESFFVDRRFIEPVSSSSCRISSGSALYLRLWIWLAGSFVSQNCISSTMKGSSFTPVFISSRDYRLLAPTPIMGNLDPVLSLSCKPEPMTLDPYLLIDFYWAPSFVSKLWIGLLTFLVKAFFCETTWCSLSTSACSSFVKGVSVSQLLAFLLTSFQKWCLSLPNVPLAYSDAGFTKSLKKFDFSLF